MTPVALFELVLALLAAALVLSLVAGRLGLPPAVALVIGGMALAFAPGLPAFDLDPDLIMVLFLPPLLLESAYFTVWRDFRASIGPILSLSLGGGAVHDAGRGSRSAWGRARPALGGLLRAGRHRLPARCRLGQGGAEPGEPAAQDRHRARRRKPRERRVRPRPLPLRRGGRPDGGVQRLGRLGSFAWLAVAGVAVGVAIGFVANRVMMRLHDANAATIVTFLVAYLAYLAAEEIHASGVLAVVACGLMLGGREHVTFDARTRTHAVAVWAFVVFVLEALVFVLIGLALRGVLVRMGGSEDALMAGLPLAVAATVTCVAARLAWVFAAVSLPRLLPRRWRDASPPLRPAIPLVIGWAGMRGVVTLAAALALPLGFPGATRSCSPPSR